MTARRTVTGRLVGMVHLRPLPGSPGYVGSIEDVVADAVARARTLADAGFPALMVENFGDVPFYADRVPAVTVAAMTRCVEAVKEATGLSVGVNVLRNDVESALSVAAATGAQFVRVNVLTGTMFTDQGPIVGRASEVIRLRERLCPDVAIWADVLVKHAVPPPGLTLEQAAADTWQRGGADALIVSGSGTGHAPDLDRFEQVRAAAPHAPLVAGSGADPSNLPEIAARCDHVIVGTYLEREGIPGAPLDPERLEAFMGTARRVGLL